MKYTNEMISEAVKTSVSYRETMLKLGMNPTGGSHAHLKSRITKADIDVSHFLGQAQGRGRAPINKLTAGEVFRVLPDTSGRAPGYQLARAMIDAGHMKRCVDCGLESWMGEPIPLDVDHVDGDWRNCMESNLQFLCPNCHRMKTRRDNNKPTASSNHCIMCSKRIYKKSKRCTDCFALTRKSSPDGGTYTRQV